jgi:hypothetical protein
MKLLVNTQFVQKIFDPKNETSDVEISSTSLLLFFCMEEVLYIFTLSLSTLIYLH